LEIEKGDKMELKWSGYSADAEWIVPEVGQYYLCEGGDHKGQEGVCVSRHDSEFGLRWAVLKFLDGTQETYRTVLLEHQP
jgi:hypothetical protein